MCSYPITDLAGFLRGTWELARDIVDAEGAAIGAFTGVGVFAPEGELLRYDESGQLRLGEHHGEASRSLRYRPEDSARCTVWFDDGHFFHDLRLDTGRWHVRHPCEGDRYEGAFEVLAPDRWQQCWYVSGPGKKYSLITRYTRLSDSSCTHGAP